MEASIVQTLQTIAGGGFLLVGLALFVLSALGMIRFPDAYTRLTAVTKAATLGICLVLLGVLILEPSLANVVKLSLAILLQLLTAPIGSFALSRGTYHSGVGLPDPQYDELTNRPHSD